MHPCSFISAPLIDGARKQIEFFASNLKSRPHLPRSPFVHQSSSWCHRISHLENRSILSHYKTNNFQISMNQSEVAAQSFQHSWNPDPVMTDIYNTHFVVPQSYIDFACSLADASGETIREYYRKFDLVSDSKTDESPVTIADRKAEAVMAGLIMEKYPDHMIIGEETTASIVPDPETLQNPTQVLIAKALKTEWCWVLDPIDGTKAFITGKATFGTLIALLRYGEPVLGIIDQPITNERWIGASGQKTTLNGNIINVNSRKYKLSDSMLAATTPDMFVGRDHLTFHALRRSTRYCNFGSDCYAYGLLACGFMDIVCEADLKIWDFMALVPVILGAGGFATDWKGMPLSLTNHYLDGHMLASGSLALHKAALAILNNQLGNESLVGIDRGIGFIETISGSGKYKSENTKPIISVEIHCEHSRYFQADVSCPIEDTELEIQLHQALKKKIGRGRITAQVKLDSKGEGFEAKHEDWGTVLQSIIDGSITLGEVAKLVNVNLSNKDGYKAEVNKEHLSRKILESVVKCADNMISMRRKKGYLIEIDIVESCDKIENDLKSMMRLCSGRGVQGSESNHLEVERIHRISSHLRQLQGSLISVSDSVGPKMKFLLEEMDRETSMVVSTSVDTGVQQVGLNVRVEIEKIRQEVENIR